MEAELKLANFNIKIIEYGMKLKLLIDQAVTRGLIIYKDWNFLSYSINTLQPDTDFFNLFLGFLAKPALEINKEIMDPIKDVICNYFSEGCKVATLQHYYDTKVVISI